MNENIVYFMFSSIKGLAETIYNSWLFPVMLAIGTCGICHIFLESFKGGGMYCPNAKPIDKVEIDEPKKIDLTKHSEKKEWWEIQIDREVR